MTAMGPSSPRLPSPPPAAEIPAGVNPSTGSRSAQSAEAILFATNFKRRIHSGTKATDMASGPPVVNLSELDSPFQLQEHLAALHYHYTENGTKPVTKETANLLVKPPNGVDHILWIYELCRFLIAQCNILIVGLLFDSPPCSAATCPEMRASEWQFLCSVHDTPKNCCAIDYSCHTLDWAANVLTDPKIFPSRLFVLNEPHSRSLANKSLVNVFRRVHRIFAHAWFLHREVFWNVENSHGVYMLFIRVCDVFDALPGDTYRLPPEAQGLPSVAAPLSVESTNDRKVSGPVTVIKQISRQTQEATSSPPPTEEGERSSSRAGIRGGRDNLSTGNQVSTVHEDEEDGSPHIKEFDDDGNQSVLHDVEITSPTDESSSDEEPPAPKPLAESKIPKPKSLPPSPELDNTEVPVIVESPTPATLPESKMPTEVPSRPKTASPKPGSTMIKSHPSKLPKKASKTKLRAISPTAVPPAMHMASGGTVIMTSPMKNVGLESPKKESGRIKEEELVIVEEEGEKQKKKKKEEGEEEEEEEEEEGEKDEVVVDSSEDSGGDEEKKEKDSDVEFETVEQEE